MGFRNIRNFDPQKMGREPGWCLMNVRLGFGITKGTFPSAKADYESQVRNGTFHKGELPPVGIAAPVYFDTASVNEHVMGADHGIYYSDGYRLANLNGWKVLGWGELCDGVRVVEKTTDPTPAPTTGFLPAKGYWTYGDKDARIGQLATFMRAVFPAYTPASALGNWLGPNLRAAIVQFQRRTGLVADGSVGPLTYAKLKSFGFRG